MTVSSNMVEIVRKTQKTTQEVAAVGKHPKETSSSGNHTHTLGNKPAPKKVRIDDEPDERLRSPPRSASVEEERDVPMEDEPTQTED